MLPIQRKISSYNHYKSNNPQWIIIHYVGGVSTAKNNVDYFYGGNRSASAHYFVDDNSIWQSVEDYHGAWHIGNSVKAPNNQNSIGIEMCCQGDGNLTVSVTTENNTVELVQYLMKKYNIDIDHVVTHGWTTGYKKICPNWSANNWERFENFKNKVINKPSTPQPSNELYRVKTKEGKQLGAFSIYENSVKCAKDNKAIIYNMNGKVVASHTQVSTIPTPPPVVKPPVQASKEKIKVTYRVHNGYKWLPPISNYDSCSDYAGVFGTTMELIECYLSKGSIIYQAHLLNGGWLPKVRNREDNIGLLGKEIDGVKMYLEGLPNHDVYYRVKLHNGAWLPWVKNLEGDGYAGIYGRRLEAIEIKILNK